jgi:RNA polymerase sigma factor (sigma-70 family)
LEESAMSEPGVPRQENGSALPPRSRLEAFRPELERATWRWESSGILSRGHDRSDLVQEVLLRAVSHLTANPHTPDEELRPLLWRMLRNHALNLIRAERRARQRLERLLRRPSPDDGPAGSPLGELIVGERDRLLAAAVEGLPANLRAVTNWLYVEGLPASELATRMGCSKRHVNMLRARALRLLRQQLWDRI